MCSSDLERVGNLDDAARRDRVGERPDVRGEGAVDGGAEQHHRRRYTARRSAVEGARGDDVAPEVEGVLIGAIKKLLDVK